MSAPLINVTLIRHAESLFNVDEELYGDVADVPITPFGVLAASRLAGGFDWLLVSPLARCQQTLACSRLTADRVTPCPLAREWRQHTCDFTVAEVEAGAPLETEAEVLLRARALLHHLRTGTNTPGVGALAAAAPSAPAAAVEVCLVTHGDLITYLVLLMGRSLEDYPDNCQSVRLEGLDPRDWDPVG
jgi:broad specificity phosphatase PhoE